MRSSVLLKSWLTRRILVYSWIHVGILISTLIYQSSSEHFTNQWAVNIKGGEDVARKLAEDHGFVYVSKIFDDHYLFRHRKVSKRSVLSSDAEQMSLQEEPQVLWLEQQVARKRVKRNAKQFNDPKWPRMWYLDRTGGLDMNVLPAWKKGYTGKGVVVSILDDGIEKDHPDLKKNYDPAASYDVNDHDPDPQPRYEYSNENRHGTRCAGVVAAEANNNICIVGVAYDAGIGGVRMLDGDVTDAIEAESLSLNPQHIDIFSASWGPEDDGKTVDGPGPLARKAFLNGVTYGRRGLGSIFVWASGNGGRDGDGCNCDGYTNSIYTLSISSGTENGHIPWYSEACSSILATTYSSGSGTERQIVTTDLRKGCTETHTGTSASAPIAAGLFALVLQANPHLTWRDLQHIVVLTARQANLEADDWVSNGVGRPVSHHFGYGLLDVSAMVNLARNWTNVPNQRKCEAFSRQAARGIPVNGNVEVALEFGGCKNTDSQVIYAEHVQAVVSLSTSRRGEVEVYLTSPSGTRSTLLKRRHRDTSTEGFNSWAFLTTHCWGELAVGIWRLEVRNAASVFYQAKLIGWALVVHGTSHHPYTAATSTVPPAEPVVDNHIPAPPSVTMQYDSIPNQNILRARFLHSDSKAVRVGPCQRPVQIQQQPFHPADNSVARYSVNELPTMSGRGKDSVLLDSRDSKEVTLKSWSLVVYGVTTPQWSSRQRLYHNNPERSSVDLLNTTPCPDNQAVTLLHSLGSGVCLSSTSYVLLCSVIFAIMSSLFSNFRDKF